VILPADHPLSDLQALAALATGWPTLHVFRPDEPSLLRARRAIEDLLGPLPQADLIEPWDPSDPEDPWELRIDLPELSPARWVALYGSLASLPGPAPVLVPGKRDGDREAWDQGWLVADTVAVDGVFAVRTQRANGSVLVPDLQRARADEAVLGLEADLVAAVQSARVGLAFASDAGPDTVTPVIHRETGRFGVQMAFTNDEPVARQAREGLLAAVGRVVHNREHHPVLRLAPDLSWDDRLGLKLTAWIIGPAAPGLPGDSPVEPGVTPFPGTLRPLLAGLGGLVEDLEVHVVPRTPADHEAVADSVGTLIAASDLPWRGSRPRWLRRGSSPVYTPTWAVPVDTGAATLSSVFAGIADLPGVESVRLVPGEPTGLGEAWQQARPSWHLGAARWLMRVRDVLTDRDRLPEVTERRPDPRDAAVAATVTDRVTRAAGARLVDRPFKAVTDSTGRAGIEVRLDAQGRLEGPLRRSLDALASIEHADLCSVAWWGYREGLPIVWLAYKTP